MSYLDTLDCEI